MANYNSTHTGAQIDAAVTKALNVDNAPTAGSSNFVTSGGVKSALDAKQNALTFDSTPTAGSSNPVTSDGIKAKFDQVQSLLTFDEVPTAGSNNPVKSKGIKSALDEKVNYSDMSAKANVNSPTFTGEPRTTKPPTGDISTRIPTTEWVDDIADRLDSNLADNFDPASTYSGDEFVLSDGILFKFLSNAEYLVYQTIDDEIYRDGNGKIYRASNEYAWREGNVIRAILANEVSKLLHRLPPAPTTDGEYTLKATVSGGVPTYHWE